MTKHMILIERANLYWSFLQFRWQWWPGTTFCCSMWHTSVHIREVTVNVNMSPVKIWFRYRETTPKKEARWGKKRLWTCVTAKEKIVSQLPMPWCFPRGIKMLISLWLTVSSGWHNMCTPTTLRPLSLGNKRFHTLKGLGRKFKGRRDKEWVLSYCYVVTSTY